MNQARLTEYSEAAELSPVAYAFEICRFAGPDGDRKFGTWGTRIEDTEPSEDDWQQSDGHYHRIRNIQPLVYGDESMADDIVGFEFTYVGRDGTIRGDTTTGDPRGSSLLVNYQPLVPRAAVKR